MNAIKKIIDELETEVLKFRPPASFYEKIGINKKRFWLLVRNEKPATVDELKAIASYFKVTFWELIEKENESAT
jgi:hypothetical protein